MHFICGMRGAAIVVRDTSWVRHSLLEAVAIVINGLPVQQVYLQQQHRVNSMQVYPFSLHSYS